MVWVFALVVKAISVTMIWKDDHRCAVEDGERPGIGEDPAEDAVCRAGVIRNDCDAMFAGVDGVTLPLLPPVNVSHPLSEFAV